MASEGETSAGIQRMAGIYNVVWAGTGALADFSGGMMLDKSGLKSIFYVPAGLQLVQLVFTFWVASRARGGVGVPASRESSENRAASAARGDARPTELNPHAVAKAKWFLRMAWLANPFAYVALNTVIAVVPGVAKRLGLSTTLAGLWCSVWCFARFGAFFSFWAWNGWPYRFRLLFGGLGGLVAMRGRMR